MEKAFLKPGKAFLLAYPLAPPNSRPKNKREFPIFEFLFTLEKDIVK
jgi:hypothetical protein